MVIIISFSFQKKARFSVLILVKFSSNESALSTELSLWADSTLSSCHFINGDILRIINNPNSIKAQISIRMLKICDDSIRIHPNLIFKSCLYKGAFSLE